MRIRMLFTGFLLVLAVVGFGQSVKPDSRLLVKYDKVYLDQIQKNSPRVIDLLNYSLDHAWFVADIVEAKVESLPELFYVDRNTGENTKPLQSFDANLFNIYEFSFKQAVDSRIYYRVGRSGLVIGFYSKLELAKMYNEEKGLSYE